MPNFEAALTLLSKVTIDKEDTYLNIQYIILNLIKL